MNTNQAAVYLDLRGAEMRKHRAAGTGPRFTCDPSGRYNYTEADLDAWRGAVQTSSTMQVPPVVRPDDAHLYPAWWPGMDAQDWQEAISQARAAAFVDGLGLVADKALDRIQRLPSGRTGHTGWRSIGIGAVHWCFDTRGDAPAWVRANVDAIRKGQDDE